MGGWQIMSEASRLAGQIAFIVEIDKLKQVLRQTSIIDNSRRENSAEHSWHLAMMALVLAEHAAAPVAIGRVVELLLVHDLVEIDAGDTFFYDDAGNADKAEREAQAASRLFGLLPPEQGARLGALWQEFEARQTPEAVFARALDRLQPMLHNFHTEGGTWGRYGITHDQVVARRALIEDGAPALWRFAETMLEEAVARGILAPGPQRRDHRR
jgi:putative hydrolase of HD superfamily